MNSLITLILIGISLSMDAFSLSLAYGLRSITKKNKITMSIIVGIYHFIMPLIGLQFGLLINNIININYIASIILIFIGLDLIHQKDSINNELNLSIIGFIIFGLSVSIDSLSIGIGLKAITNNYYLSSIIFSITSTIFTFLGLSLGNIISHKIGEYSTKIGGTILLIIAIIIFIN